MLRFIFLFSLVFMVGCNDHDEDKTPHVDKIDAGTQPASLIQDNATEIIPASLIQDNATEIIPASLIQDNATEIIPASLIQDNATEIIPASLIQDNATETSPMLTLTPAGSIHAIQLCSAEFASFNDVKARGYGSFYTSSQIKSWTDELKAAVNHQLDLTEQILNSDQFKTLYNKQAPSILIQSESPNGFPTTYQELADNINDQQQCPYHFVLLEDGLGAQGGQNTPWVFMHENQYKNNTGLFLHELTHTWGYDHTDANHTLWPTNLSYMLQIMVNKKADDLEQKYCGGGRCDPSSGLGLKAILGLI